MKETGMKAANSNNLCQICGKNPALPKFHPFCSGRCADVDLGRWLKGSYTIPAETVDNSETEPDDTY